MNSNYKNLSVRVKTAAVLLIGVTLALFLASVSQFGCWLLMLLGVTAVSMAAWEFASICSSNVRAVKFWSYLIALALPAIVFLGALSFSTWGESVRAGAMLAGSELKIIICGFFLSVVILFALLCYLARYEIREAELISRESFLGLIHIGLCGALLSALPLHQGGVGALLWLLAVIISNDVAAYFVGSKFQGPKLCVALSPGKTISGGIGALIGSLVLGLALFNLLPGGYGRYGIFAAICLTLLISLFAQSADLAKSFIKRLYNVKDSGTILPGHGGVLDRIDGLLAGSAIVYLWIL